MIERYKILYRGGTGELTEKKSRFIATMEPVRSEPEAIAFINKTKKQYWDARHHCYAYVLGAGAELCRCSDDGEPSQTAGRPMLDVLLGQEIRDICVVVARYFGGTLLGTGGLIRAYSGAVQAGLKASQTIEKQLGHKVWIKAAYNEVGKLKYLLGQHGIATLAEEYGTDAALTVVVPVDQSGAVAKEITEATGGRAAFESLGTIYYGTCGREILLLEE